jgi:hypothetical protein
MRWFESTAAVLGGLLLSIVLVVLVGAVVVRTPEMQLVFDSMREGQSGRDLPAGGAASVLTAMNVTDFRMRWIIGPGIAALVGTFVGFLANGRVWQMAVLAAMPYAFLFSGGWSSGSEAMLSALYVGVAGLTAWVVSNALRRRRGHAPNTVRGVSDALERQDRR